MINESKEYKREKKKIIKDTKKNWWAGFGFITFLAFMMTTFPDTDYKNKYGLFFGWLIILITFVTFLFFSYKKSLKNIKYLKEKNNR